MAALSPFFMPLPSAAALGAFAFLGAAEGAAGAAGATGVSLAAEMMGSSLAAAAGFFFSATWLCLVCLLLLFPMRTSTLS